MKFLRLGLSVEPVAGSVLTWRNVDRHTREVRDTVSEEAFREIKYR